MDQTYKWHKLTIGNDDIDNEMFLFVLQYEVSINEVMEMLDSNAKEDFLKLKRLLYD